MRARAPLIMRDISEPIVGADVLEAPIAPEIVLALEKVWGQMTLAARWPDRETAIRGLKFGGTIYTFDYYGDNVYGQGQVVSPESGTCSAALVAIGDLLSRFADERDDKARQELGVQLISESRRLATER